MSFKIMVGDCRDKVVFCGNMFENCGFYGEVEYDEVFLLVVWQDKNRFKLSQILFGRENKFEWNYLVLK